MRASLKSMRWGGDGASPREYTHSHMCMCKPHVFTNLPVTMEKKKTGLIPGEVSLFIGQYVVFSDRENAHGLQGRSSADVGSAQAKVRMEGSLTLRAPGFSGRKRWGFYFATQQTTVRLPNNRQLYPTTHCPCQEWPSFN